MASTTEGDKKWKKRRLSLAKAEKMRAAKRARAEASAPILSIAESTRPSLETSSTEPGPSGLQQEISVATSQMRARVRRARVTLMRTRRRVCSTTGL